MADNGLETRDPSVTEKEAIAWFTRMNGRPSPAEHRDFEKWLDTSPENRDAFHNVRLLWQKLSPSGEMSTEEPDGELQEPLRKIHQLRAARKFNKTGPLIATCLAFLIAGTWLWLVQPNLLEDWNADFVSARGERREIRLADGSRILMDADTALDVDMSDGERHVRLRRGTAFFDVVHSHSAFVVEAENGEIRVLGTQFDVATREKGRVSVTLASGSIELRNDTNAQKLVLKPGESVDYDAQGVGAVRQVPLEDEMSWHQGRFIFNDARLTDVLAQIERYRTGRIVLLGSALGERRVSGNIPLDDTDQALAAVQASVGFRLTSFGRLTVVSP